MPCLEINVAHMRKFEIMSYKAGGVVSSNKICLVQVRFKNRKISLIPILFDSFAHML